MKKHWSEVIPFVTYSDFQPKIRKPVMSSGPKPLREPAISATNYSTLKSRNFLFFFKQKMIFSKVETILKFSKSLSLFMIREWEIQIGLE